MHSLIICSIQSMPFDTHLFQLIFLQQSLKGIHLNLIHKLFLVIHLSDSGSVVLYNKQPWLYFSLFDLYSNATKKGRFTGFVGSQFLSKSSELLYDTSSLCKRGKRNKSSQKIRSHSFSFFIEYYQLTFSQFLILSVRISNSYTIGYKICVNIF